MTEHIDYNEPRPLCRGGQGRTAEEVEQGGNVLIALIAIVIIVLASRGLYALMGVILS